jgi:predicted Zn-dependent protease
MVDVRVGWWGLLVALACSGCVLLPEPVPSGAFTPGREEPRTEVMAHTLYRAARAADDDPAKYAFALVKTQQVTTLAAGGSAFYFSEGLASQPAAVIDALVAQAVAHDVLSHRGKMQSLSVGISAGFTVVGLLVPGLSLIDYVVNPLVTRAYTRDQQLGADRKAVEMLAAMGHEDPRRTLAEALLAAAAANGERKGRFWERGFLAREPLLETRLAALGYPRSATAFALRGLTDPGVRDAPPEPP